MGLFIMLVSSLSVPSLHLSVKCNRTMKKSRGRRQFRSFFRHAHFAADIRYDGYDHFANRVVSAPTPARRLASQPAKSLRTRPA